MHPVGKNYALDQKFFDGPDELYRHAKFREDHTMHAGCRCENVVFFCNTQSRAGCSLEWNIFEQLLCRVIALSEPLDSSYFRR